MIRALMLLALLGTAHAQPERPRLELPQQNLTDGQKIQVVPITVTPSKAERDQRSMFIGGGVIVLAAVLWWNRKRRERFEEDVQDNEELRAAARGDTDSGKDV